MNKKALLFLNGEVPTIIPNTDNYEEIFCTDGAFHYLKKLNITPDVIAGDFDSVQTNDFPETIEIVSTPDQNDTDFAKTLEIIIEKGYKAVDVFGASGQQQDHFMGNLNAAFRFKNEIKITFYDNYSTYFFADKKTILTGHFNQTISLLPFPECKGIVTKGLKYPLHHEDLNLLSRIGTRNKAIDDNIEIEFSKGDLIIFIINPDYPILLA